MSLWRSRVENREIEELVSNRSGRFAQGLEMLWKQPECAALQDETGPEGSLENLLDSMCVP